MMLAEKAADLILGNTPLLLGNTPLPPEPLEFYRHWPAAGPPGADLPGQAA